MYGKFHTSKEPLDFFTNTGLLRYKLIMPLKAVYAPNFFWYNNKKEICRGEKIKLFLKQSHF